MLTYVTVYFHGLGCWHCRPILWCLFPCCRMLTYVTVYFHGLGCWHCRPILWCLFPCCRMLTLPPDLWRSQMNVLLSWILHDPSWHGDQQPWWRNHEGKKTGWSQLNNWWILDIHMALYKTALLTNYFWTQTHSFIRICGHEWWHSGLHLLFIASRRVNRELGWSAMPSLWTHLLLSI